MSANDQLKAAGVDLQVPEHPDFRTLVAIQQQIDEITQAEGWHIAVQEFAGGTDMASMGYLANMQSVRAQTDLAVQDDGTPIEERERNVILWMDAYITGYRMAQLAADGVVLRPDGNRRARRAKGKKNRA